MDLENGIQMGKIPLTEGVSSLPSPNSHKAMLGHPDFDPEDDDVYLKKLPEWTYREMAISGVASVSVLTSMTALIIAGINPIIYITAIAGMIIPPYSALQEQKITDCKALKETNLAMEREMENIKYNNYRLKTENDELEASVKRFQDMQLAYNECQKLEKVSVSALESQLNASKVALAQMDASRVNEIIDNIFDIIIAVDADENSSLDDSEIDLFIKKMEGIMGLEVSDYALKKNIIDKGRDIDAIVSLLKDLLGDNGADQLKDKERILRIID